MKWTNITKTSDSYNIQMWNSPIEDFNDGDIVICLNASNHRLVSKDGSFKVVFNRANFPSDFVPNTLNDEFLIYGVNTNSLLRMPFNRVDYYIDKSAVLPPRCAKNTGIFTRAIISHSDGSKTEQMPIMDCVADMQVIFMLDSDGDGIIDRYTDLLKDISGVDLDAEQIREQLKEVRVYLLSHEGQKDSGYKYPNSNITVGEFGAGRTFNLSTSGITDWENYRWKIYRIAAQPNNLG